MHAQGAQQGKGLQAARDRERLGGVDEKAPRQQCHQGQHVEIDAIRARQCIALHRLIIAVAQQGARREQWSKPRADDTSIGAFSEFQIDPVNPPQSAESSLGRGNIDDAQPPSLSDRRQYTANNHYTRSAVGTDRQAIADLDPRCSKRRT